MANTREVSHGLSGRLYTEDVGSELKKMEGGNERGAINDNGRESLVKGDLTG